MRSLLAWAVLFAPCVAACEKPASTNNPDLRDASQTQDMWSLHQQLEEMIDAQRATERDREFVHQQASEMADDGTAKWAFARAAITGRLAESKGLKALGLIREVETYARLSMERDPEFQRGAAKRMLGTLYILAGDHVEHGDSEVGLEMLEKLIAADPEEVHNQLRLAQGYISLGDPDPALEYLCLADAQRDQLQPDEQRLLDRLFTDVGGRALVGCE